jgi:signal transduction histidine kinase
MPHVILFVDDEPEVLELLRCSFPAEDGCEALTASGGEEALRVLAERPIDLLVTDQRMPGMTGVELIAAARRRLPDLCAILLTGYTHPREIVDAINRGEVYRYLVKPWRGADLDQAVRQALEQVELKRERARLHALVESLEEFVQVVSHEIRTPLTSIAGALDLLLNGIAGALEGKQERYVRMARDSSEALNALLDDLLDVARLAEGKLRMELAPTELDALVRAAADRYQAAAAERGQELHVELPDERVGVLADAARLGQVLSNLLTNAVKFAPTNGVIRVRVFRSDSLPGLVGLSVWNSGEGIPEGDLERIFERFERSERTRRVRGTGLGLWICRGIVEAHGGRMWAESAPGEGARFVAVIPDDPDLT